MAGPSPPVIETTAVNVPLSEKSFSPSESKEDLSDGLRSRADSNEKLPLADRSTQDPPSSLGDAVLRLLRLRKRRAEHDLDSVATQGSVFDTEQAEYYKPTHDWENIGNFDPDFRWTWREEKKVIRATDWKIMVWLCVMFLALDIDRYNLSNATADNMLNDINITRGDYNLGNTLSRVGFLVAELPSQLISKRLGPDRWIPIQICIFSIIAAAQFWLSGRASFLATRFLIAAFQGGFIPDVILYASYFYTKKELPLRLAFFWMINYFANMLTGFLGVGLLKMRGIGGYAGWRWMFLIEGLFTFSIGVLSFFMMPSSPSQTKTWFRKNGYFTDRQAKIIVNRVIRDDPGKGTMHNRQALSIKMIFKCIGNYDMYPLYAIGLTFGIAGYPINNYLQLSFKSLGFSTVKANLLSVPNTALSMINLLVVTVVSELVDNRSFVAMAENVWMLGPVIALTVMQAPTAWEYFAITTVLLGFPYVHAIQVAWTSRNSGTVQNRTVSASLYNMMVQTSAIIGANIYEPKDAPRYNKGNKVLLGIIAWNLVVAYPFAYFYYRWRNHSNAKVWNAMTSEEKSHYLATTKKEGNQRLDFQFAY